MNDTRHSPEGTLGRRLVWFIALWLMGVLTVTVISYGLRLWIAPS